jgi:hypothetical protein
MAFGSTALDPDAAEITVGGIARPFSILELRGATSVGSVESVLSGGASLLLGGMAFDQSTQRIFGSQDTWGVAAQMRFGI